MLRLINELGAMLNIVLLGSRCKGYIYPRRQKQDREVFESNLDRTAPVYNKIDRAARSRCAESQQLRRPCSLLLAPTVQSLLCSDTCRLPTRICSSVKTDMTVIPCSPVVSLQRHPALVRYRQVDLPSPCLACLEAILYLLACRCLHVMHVWHTGASAIVLAASDCSRSQR